jgi:hypothetical protein
MTDQPTESHDGAPVPHVEWSSIHAPDADGWYNHIAVASELPDITGRLVTDDKDDK